MIRFIAHSILLTALLMLISPQIVMAEAIRLDEYEIKAAYLYNFAKYVDWPATALPRENSFMTICVIGKSPLNTVLELLAEKKIKGRRITIRVLSQSDPMDNCSILFVNATMRGYLPEILALTTPRSVLTVGDYGGFAAAGGIIELVPVRDKIRFEINNRSAKKSNLRISSQLLSLATKVIE